MFLSASNSKLDAARAIRFAAAALVLLLGAATQADANALDNGDFPDETMPWKSAANSNGMFTVYWSNLDHSNNSSSGSGRFTAQPLMASSIYSEGNTVSAGAQLSAGGYFRATSTPPSGSVVKMQIRFFSSNPAYNPSDGRNECPSASYISAQNSTYKPVSGSWAPFTMSATAPAGAKCALVSIDATVQVGMGEPTPPGFDLLVDGVYLNGGTSETLPSDIFSSDFDSGNLNGWQVVQ